MKTILEEDLQRFRPVHIAVNGKEALMAVRTALSAGMPFDLVRLDIMMDGKRQSRRSERWKKV